MKNILVAGATGYLGRYLAKNLVEQQFDTTVLVRNREKFNNIGISVNGIIEAEVTDVCSLAGCCKGIDVVISSIGITRQTDGLSYMDVDYQANLNLLEEARKSGVKKFIYVSVLHGDRLTSLKICEAKERFVEELQQSGLEYCVIRPNGFFSDMTEFYTMAKKGRIYLFGDGMLKSNPIHGDDLAKACVKTVNGEEAEVEIGGPETLTQKEIAHIAFEAAGTPVKITHIPDWVRRVILKLLSFFLSKSKFGPVEFFLSVMAMDMCAPEFGTVTLRDYFQILRKKNGSN